MKKFVFIALAALAALSGCRKETSLEQAAEAFIFTSDNAGTRTEWTGETIRWSAGDAISMAYTVDGAWQGPALYGSDPLTAAAVTARFRVPAAAATSPDGAYVFHAVYPAAASSDFSDAPDYLTAIPVRQTPAADSYDPAADLMVGHSDPFESRPEGEIPLRWTRLTAHGDLTLTNLGLAAGEKVASVLFTAQDRAELAGDILVDLETGETATGGTNSVWLDGRNLAPDASGNLRCWVSILPVTLTELTVRVETDQATYSKHFSGISKTFLENSRNLLEINMKNAEVDRKEPAGTEYVLVKAAPADWTGDYLIVHTGAGVALTCGSASDDRASGTAVTISGEAIPYAGNEALNVRIEKDGTAYTMKQGNLYLGLESAKNSLNFKSEASGDAYHWNLSFSGGNTLPYNVKNTKYVLQWNSSAKIFRCYTSSQQPVQFYRLNGSSEGSGGGDTPTAPSVTTGGVKNVSTTEATLTATYTGDVTYAGFEMGLSPDALTDEWVSQSVFGGAFSTTASGLAPGKTYYYRAYIAVLEGSSYQYYYGDVASFATPSDAVIIVDGSQPGWFETPLMHVAKDGNYKVNADDRSEYYAWHMCTGGEKGPGGKTARNYTVCYSATHHCPVWVAAPRHSMYVGSAGRNDSYRQDPDIPSGIQYSSKSTGGGCNKGHMLGSAERTSSKATNRDVFYYTNIAPQLSSGFNTGGGGWNTLEDWVDTQVCADTLYEVVGCYFKQFTDGYGESASPATISFGGRNDVSRPTMFYYALLRTKKGNSGKSVRDCGASELKCAAFVRTHTNNLKGQSVTSREMKSISELERIVGVTFFPNVPNAPKDTFTASDWGL